MRAWWKWNKTNRMRYIYVCTNYREKKEFPENFIAFIYHSENSTLKPLTTKKFYNWSMKIQF